MVKRLGRIPLLMMGMLTLLGSIWGGLVRLGWDLPPLAPALVTAHGPLLIAGFLGTVISLERAVALERRWPYLAPAASAMGAMALIAGAPWLAGTLLLALGSAVLCTVYITLLRRQQSLHTWTMAAGAASLLAGNVLWAAGWSVSQSIGCWMAFVVLTIAGERLELARLRHLSPTAYGGFVTAAGALASGAIAAAFWHDAGLRLAGAGMVVLAWWLFRHDLTLTVPSSRPDPLRSFMARSLALGYLWLFVGGGLMVSFGDVSVGMRYDAIVHTIFLGFGVTMIFAHAPVIVPAVLRLPVAFSAASYVPLVLLQASLLFRVTGDLIAWGWLRQWGGMINALAVLAFLAVSIASVLRATTTTARRESEATPFPPGQGVTRSGQGGAQSQSL